MKWLAVVAALVLAASCTAGQPSYVSGVAALPSHRAHPLFQQLLPVLERPSNRTTDELVQVWKEFLGANAVPLRSENSFTFVYYDFTHSLSEVYLEASFAPQRFDPLERVGTTPLFFRVYSVPKAGNHRYRYSTGTKVLLDPFHPTLETVDDPWHPIVVTTTDEPLAQWIVGAAEPELEGHDLQILLPPFYRRNLGQTYPLVVLVGLQGNLWMRALDQLQREGSIQPLLTVSVGNPAGLKVVLEERVVPWMRSHYRASGQAADLILVGWGTAIKAVQDLAAARPDFWTKSWTPLADQARGEEAWTTLAPPFFRTQFPVVTP